jgi:hypothetical protein
LARQRRLPVPEGGNDGILEYWVEGEEEWELWIPWLYSWIFQPIIPPFQCSSIPFRIEDALSSLFSRIAIYAGCYSLLLL